MNEYEAQKMYEDYLDECFGTVEICGITFSSSRALKELDPIAFDCGMAYWLDSEGIEIE